MGETVLSTCAATTTSAREMEDAREGLWLSLVTGSALQAAPIRDVTVNGCEIETIH